MPDTTTLEDNLLQQMHIKPCITEVISDDLIYLVKHSKKVNIRCPYPAVNIIKIYIHLYINFNGICCVMSFSGQRNKQVAFDCVLLTDDYLIVFAYTPNQKYLSR